MGELKAATAADGDSSNPTSPRLSNRNRSNSNSLSSMMLKNSPNRSSSKRLSGHNLFLMKRMDNSAGARFGVVHVVRLMKFRSKRKETATRMNYLLFGGDTTGCIWAWNLSLK